jgi:hypothetical protein
MAEFLLLKEHLNFPLAVGLFLLVDRFAVRYHYEDYFQGAEKLETFPHIDPDRRDIQRS